MTLSVTKRYDEIPFAHRQHTHKGHCALIHGHNWSFEFEFSCSRFDENGFVIDFGQLSWLKEILMEWDHKCLLAEDDPIIPLLENVILTRPSSVIPGAEALSSFIGIVKIPKPFTPSCEGLAFLLYEKVSEELVRLTNNRVWLQSVTVHEDSRNKATRSFR
jgi:6-pyruvoyltetrahydropterin/6-carboxytetrahydropterin synthase